MDLQLQGSLALVTGSTAGIGLAIAARLAEEGANVIINGRSEAAVNNTIAELQPRVSGELLAFAGDMSSAPVIDQIYQKYSEVDILVNNLGIFEPKDFLEIPDQDWQRLFEVNVLSGVRLCRTYLPAMKKRDAGRIIFISSESGVQIPAEMIHYGMTKAAQIAIARGLAESLAGTGITVNSVLPGPTYSRGVGDFVSDLADQQGKSLEEFEADFFSSVRPTSLIKRFAETDEVATMVAYIASPLASATTGAAVRVDGGVIKSAF